MRILFILGMIVSLLYATPEIEITGNGNSITDGDATPSATDDTDFGYAHVDTETPAVTYTINNAGTDTLDISSISLIGDANFSITTNPSPTTIAAAGSATFVVTFDPSETGVITATVQVDNNDSNENPFTFSIQGEGAYPEISITGIADGGSDNFGNAHVSTTTGDGSVTGNGSVTTTYTINNTGNVALDLSAGAVLTTGTHFTVAAQPAATVAAGASTTFQITFDPTITGTVPNDNVSLANDDQDENPYNFTLQGTGTFSEIYVRGNGIDITDGGGAQDTTDDTFFGSENINTGSSTRTYTIYNEANSTEDLTISSITSSIGDYTILPTSMTIAAGATDTFTVTFDPTALGDRLSTITINNDDTTDTDASDESVYTFSIRGIGDNNVTASTSLTYNNVAIEYAESPALTTTITPMTTLPDDFPYEGVGSPSTGREWKLYSKSSGAVTLDVTGGANGFTYEYAFRMGSAELQKEYIFLGALKYGPNYLDGTNHWYDFGKKSDNDASGDVNKIGTGYEIRDNGGTLHIYLEDGLWGDDDMVANGTITDPLFPVIGLRIPVSNYSYIFLILGILAVAFINKRKSQITQ